MKQVEEARDVAERDAAVRVPGAEDGEFSRRRVEVIVSQVHTRQDVVLKAVRFTS